MTLVEQQLAGADSLLLVEMILGIGHGSQVSVQEHEAERVALGLGDAVTAHATAHIVWALAERGVRVVPGKRIQGIALDAVALEVRDHGDFRWLAPARLDAFTRAIGFSRGQRRVSKWLDQVKVTSAAVDAIALRVSRMVSPHSSDLGCIGKSEGEDP